MALGASTLMFLSRFYSYNRLSRKTSAKKAAPLDEHGCLEGLALNAVKQYIEEVRATLNDSLKMCKLAEVYDNALTDLM